MKLSTYQQATTIKETVEQVKVVSWFKWQYRALGNCLFAIPNGSVLAGDKKQRAIQMARLKREGVLPGVADLFLMVGRQGRHGLFIEMKRKEGGKLSLAQKNFLTAAQNQGYQAVVCAGADEAINVIKDYLS